MNYLDVDHVLPDGRRITFEAADDRAAAELLVAGAVRAVAVLPPGVGSVEVVGHGMLAELIRHLLPGDAVHALGDDRSVDDDRPDAVIETTGDPATLTAATERLRDLGCLVLAGPPADRSWELDLYPDVHVRGLRLVGLDPMAPAPAPATATVPVPAPTSDSGGPDTHLVELALGMLEPHAAGDELPAAWRWCRVESPGPAPAAPDPAGAV